ncbi:MAG: condensation domain-containing protein, partial [Acidobacteriota bacterium]|nr:condensation domain-containing protein [Acidobacteriota bacterium]
MDTALSGVEDRYALSPIQQTLLDESLSAQAGSRIGLLQLVWDLLEPLDLEAFERAWGRLAERHPILRTRLALSGRAEPCQEVLRRAPPPFATCDWTAVPPERQEELLSGWLLEDRRRGLDLTRAPLLRVMVARWSPGHHRVVLTIHHTLFDGRTLLALIQEVFAFYESISRGQDLELPPPRPYRAYVEWLAAQDQERARAYWQQTLQGIREPTALGIERPAGGQGGKEAAPVWLYDDISIWLSQESTGALLSFAHRLGLTLNTLLLGAWSYILGRYSARRDVLFGVVRTHRGAMPDGAAILGPMMGSMPLRVIIAPDLDLATWLQTLRSRWLAMRAADFVSPAAIRGWSELAPHAPLFENLVLFETHELTEHLRRKGADWQARSFRFVRQSRVPLSVYGYLEKRLSLKIIWDPDRFDRLPIQRLLGQLRTVLEAMPCAEVPRLEELPLLSAPERQQLLVEWNDTVRTGIPVPVHRRFEQHAHRSPQTLAAEDPAGRRTYGQLDAGADRLARVLAARGVGPGVLVGVYLERSADQAQVLLAVLKA